MSLVTSQTARFRTTGFYGTFSEKCKKNQNKTKKMPAADRVEAFTAIRKHWRFEFDIIFQANRKWFAAVPQSSPAGKCCYLNNIYASKLFFLSPLSLTLRLYSFFLLPPYSYFGYARPLSCQRHAASHLYRYIDSHWGVAGGSCTLSSAAVQRRRNNRCLCKCCGRTARSHLTQISCADPQ